MTPGAVRRALHAAHALTSVLLIATGLLLWDPDLRARFVGGYGREILEAHLWVGALLLGAPILAGLLAGRVLLRDLLRRSLRGRSSTARWTSDRTSSAA